VENLKPVFYMILANNSILWRFSFFARSPHLSYALPVRAKPLNYIQNELAFGLSSGFQLALDDVSDSSFAMDFFVVPVR
jgi:hypothetical protein